MAGPLFRELGCAIGEAVKGDVTLFTGHPDTTKYFPKISELNIRLMPGYNRRSKITRVFSWLSYTVCSVIELVRMKKSETAIVVSNPPTMVLFLILARLLGKRYIVIIYDIFPDVFVSLGFLSPINPVVKVWCSLNKIAWNGAQGVFTIANRMASNLETQFDSRKTVLGHVAVLPVWVDTNTLKPIPRSKNTFAADLGLKNKFIVLYSGNMGLSHDINSILEAAKALSNIKEIAFVLIGQGAKWNDAVRFQNEHSLENLMVLPFQSEDILPMSLGMADLGIVSLETGAGNVMIPSKTYYYMSVGAAVIGICDIDSELADTLTLAQCGTTVSPGKPQELANIISGLFDNTRKLETFKQSARSHCVKFHRKEVCVKSFITTLKDL
mgnify:CR=1 FL=1